MLAGGVFVLEAQLCQIFNEMKEAKYEQRNNENPVQ